MGAIPAFGYYSNANKYSTLEGAQEYLTKNRKLKPKFEYAEVYNTRQREEEQVDFQSLLKDLTDPEEIRVYQSIIKRLNK